MAGQEPDVRTDLVGRGSKAGQKRQDVQVHLPAVSLSCYYERPVAISQVTNKICVNLTSALFYFEKPAISVTFLSRSSTYSHSTKSYVMWAELGHNHFSLGKRNAGSVTYVSAIFKT